ncbi:MAG: hypothetical protein IBJ09_10295 [Bacteroidia bacterium]|nr:hypothetical protein [Bacteroidia bacterium]
MKTSRFSAFMFSILFAAGWFACDPKEKDPLPEDCPDSVYFIKYDDYGYSGLPRSHFTTPDGRWFQVYDNKLALVKPGNDLSKEYEAEHDIIPQSVRVMPDGGIFFLDGFYVYYIGPNGYMNHNTDMYAGVSVPFDDTWYGAAFTTAEGYYGYADRDGDGFRVNLRTPSLGIVDMINYTSVPQGDCLGAYHENGVYTVVRSFQFQGNPYVQRYRFYKQGNTIHTQITDVQIPEETKGKEWHNFKPDGNGFATFDIYENDVVHHYRIDIQSGGPYAILPDTPLYIEAPGCTYRFSAQKNNTSGACLLRVMKMNSSGAMLWHREIPTGNYLLFNIYGWAHTEGVYLHASYFPETYSGVGNCRIYISADGAVCD